MTGEGGDSHVLGPEGFVEREEDFNSVTHLNERVLREDDKGKGWGGRGGLAAVRESP